MDGLILIIVVTILVAGVLGFITFLVVKKKSNGVYRKKINQLEVAKNQLLSVDLLSEITKVRDLVKTDNLKHKLDGWDETFNNIKEVKVPMLTDKISEVEFMIDKNDIKNATKKIAEIELEIGKIKRITNKLIEEIKIITNSEERNRALITKYKVIYRECQSKFERNEDSYCEAIDSIKIKFELLDNKFKAFEEAIESNDYVLVEQLIVGIEEDIDNLKEILEKVPSLILMTNVLIPGKIDEVKVSYARMQRDGYPLDYLNVDYNIEEITKKNTSIKSNIVRLELGDSEIELKTMLDYFNSLFNDFDKEKECKDLFKEGCKKFRHKIDKVNKVVYDVYIQIDDIKVTYDLTDEEINKFSVLNKNLEMINEDFKRLLDEGKTNTFSYSKLNDELEGLGTKLSRLQDDLDYHLRSITSMKDDEYRAKEQLKEIQDLLKKSKNKLKDYKLPVIPSSYYVELKEAQDAIREIVKELDKKPIVIKILNIRVDTARDLAFKIYNKTNDMIKSSMISEKMIIYGNRYRLINSEVSKGLDEATKLFYKGFYDKSLETSIAAIKLVDEDPMSNIF